jgi:hypothetical protein
MGFPLIKEANVTRLRGFSLISATVGEAPEGSLKLSQEKMLRAHGSSIPEVAESIGQ